MGAVNFGVGIPTGTEGLMYPVPFASARDNILISTKAEELGYDSVWGNDHVSTQDYVRNEFSRPPSYYAPLLILASIAENTTRLKVATALLVTAFRHPVLVAKELATLDHLTNGRLLVGVGIGAYREEFEALLGPKARDVHRGRMMEECMGLVTRLFKEESVSHSGEYFETENVQVYPKPVQNPFPFYVGGNAPIGRKRTALYGTGWLPAVLSPEEITNGISEIQHHCEEIGRDPTGIDIAPQLSVAIGKTREEAMNRFTSSQLYKHMESLRKSTLKDQTGGSYDERNLIGSPADIAEKVREYIEAGVTTFSALLFAGNSLQEFMDSMQLFAEEVMPHFSQSR